MSEISPEFQAVAKKVIDQLSRKNEDANLPSEMERQHLALLMYNAFCELRWLAREKRNEQAADLADAMHNLPLLMHRSDFSMSFFRASLTRYREKYPGNGSFDYLQEWEKLQNNPGSK